MRTHKDVSAEEFSTRLRLACQERGHTSARNSSGIDVSAVAKNTHCSYEMARRYVAGLALPGEDTMRAMAEWLRVPLAWLAFGERAASSPSGEVSTACLESCLVAIQEAQELAGVALPPARVAALAAALYREAVEGKSLSARTVAASIRALT
jgi:transcriptional regulator with XRE-family HTH domain